MKTHPTRVGLFGVGLGAYWRRAPLRNEPGIAALRSEAGEYRFETKWPD